MTERQNVQRYQVRVGLPPGVCVDTSLSVPRVQLAFRCFARLHPLLCWEASASTWSRASPALSCPTVHLPALTALSCPPVQTLMQGSEPVESHLRSSISEFLNAEVVLGTIRTTEEAAMWIKSESAGRP